MENDDDPRLKRIQEFLRRSPEAIAPMNHMRAILRAVSAAAPDKRAGILMRASKMAMPPVTAGEVNQLLAEFPTPAAAQGYLRSLAEMAKETERKADEIASQARGAFASQLKDLKSEADLTWDNIATESGISRRRLYEISAGAKPSAATARILRDYSKPGHRNACIADAQAASLAAGVPIVY